MARKSTKSTLPAPKKEQWDAAKRQSASVTGYGNTSPIWGKKDVTVFAEIQEHLERLAAGTSTGLELDQAIQLIKELQKREAYKRLIPTFVERPVAAAV